MTGIAWFKDKIVCHFSSPCSSKGYGRAKIFLFYFKRNALVIFPGQHLKIFQPDYI